MTGFVCIENPPLDKALTDNAHLIIEFSQEGGILNAANI